MRVSKLLDEAESEEKGKGSKRGSWAAFNCACATSERPGGASVGQRTALLRFRAWHHPPPRRITPFRRVLGLFSPAIIGGGAAFRRAAPTPPVVHSSRRGRHSASRTAVVTSVCRPCAAVTVMEVRFDIIFAVNCSETCPDAPWESGEIGEEMKLE